MSSADQDAGRIGDGVRIQRASTMLGVPISTMRSWERRYGVPSPGRSSGGHRRYSEHALNELRLMRDEITHGKGAAGAARAVRQMLDPTEPGADRIAQLLAASRSRDRESVIAALDDAALELGLGPTIDEILMPAMRQIGTWWEHGHCDVEQESFTTAVVRSWLARREIYAPRPTTLAPLLIACGPRDRHTIGLEALAAVLAHRRRTTVVLGPGTTTETLVAAVRATSPSAVALVSHLTSNRRGSVAALTTLADTGCPTFYAGNAFMFPGARLAVPGTYLGESFVGAADLIQPT